MAKKIVIDAGHGGSDSGAVGNGIIEKELTLKIAKYIYDRLNELGADVIVDDDLALVAIVGRNMKCKSGVCGNIFSTMGNLGINVKIIAQGPSELSIIIGVEAKDYEKTLKALYSTLIG